jgi:hypothetical protein
MLHFHSLLVKQFNYITIISEKAPLAAIKDLDPFDNFE